MRLLGMKKQHYPTYDQVMAIEPGRFVIATLRSKSGERAKVSGILHTNESGARSIGPVDLCGMRAGYRDYRYETAPPKKPWVIPSLVEISS